MKIKREEFLRKLEMVAPGLLPREIGVEQATCFVFQNKEVMTYNDEISCRSESGLDKSFNGAVQAKPLRAILHKLQEDDLEVELKNGEMVFTGKGKSTGIRCEKDITLPINIVEKPETWKRLHDDFGDAVDIVQQCVGKDESMFAFTCLHLHPKWIEGSDNFQLTRYRLKTGVSESTLVRKEAIKHIVNIGMVEFSETKAWIHFRNAAGLVMSCRRYMEEYRDLTALLDVQGEPASLPKGLAEAADKAEVFSAENIDENQVLVELKPGKVRIKGQGISGWYKEEKKIAYDGQPMSFMISPKLLSQLTTKHNECVLGKGRLMVDGGKYIYVTVLRKTPEAKKAEKEGKEFKWEGKGEE